MAFDSSVGGTSSNSYVSVGFADDFFTLHLEGDQWKIPTAKKQAALVQATSRLDRERFSGQKTNVDQSLEWPRTNVLSRTSLLVHDNVNTFTSGRFFIDPTIIPKQLAEATCLLALHYLKETNGDYIVSDSDSDRVTNMSVGPLTLTLKNRRSDSLPQKVKDLLNSIGEQAWLGNYTNKVST